MATTCLDKIYCENAWSCSITILDTEGNPIDPLLIEDYDNIVVVLGDKPGYIFQGFIDENGNPVPSRTSSVADNAYEIDGVLCNKQYLAKYCAIEYIVGIQSDSHDCFVGDSSTMNAHYGDIVTITANESNTCRFVYWLCNGQIVSEERTFTHVVTENITFTAHYDVIKYTITAKPDNLNQGVCTGGGHYELGENVTIEATPISSTYVFSGWDDGNNDNPRIITVNGNATYVANFATQQVNIQVPMTTGGAVIGSGDYKSGNVVTLQAVPEQGWRFSHWIMNGEVYSEETLRFVASSDITPLPFFTPNTYSLQLEAVPYASGTFTVLPQPPYEYGDTATLTAVPSYGYVFVEWSDGVTNPQRIVNFLSDVSLKAIFAVKESVYNLSIVLPNDTYFCDVYYNGENVGYKNGSLVTASSTQGSTLTIVPITPDGKRLVNVTDSNGSVVWENNTTTERVQPIIYTIGDEDETLTLHFENLSYSLYLTIEPLSNDLLGNTNFTISIGGSTQQFTPTIAETMRTYPNLTYNSQITITAPSTVGSMQFAYWATDIGGFGTNAVSFGMNKDVKCVAVYQEAQITDTQSD